MAADDHTPDDDRDESDDLGPSRDDEPEPELPDDLEPEPYESFGENEEYPRFSARRKEHAAQVDPLVIPLLCQYYGVSVDAVHDVEGECANGPPETWGPLTYVDIAGIDKLLDGPDHFVGVSIRTRPAPDSKPNSEPDLALREQNGSSYDAEYYKFLSAHRNNGLYPNVILYAITRPPAHDELVSATLIDTPTLLDAILTGAITPDGPHPTGNGAECVYIPISDIALNCRDALLARWVDGDRVA